MRKLFIIFIFIIALAPSLYGQRTGLLKGVVYGSVGDGKREPVPFATVYWLESGTFMDCDEKGAFTFTTFKQIDATLVASAVGYNKDTVTITPQMTYVEFNLVSINELQQALILGKSQTNYLSKLSSVRTEVISAAGLCKMACCNLAESFENSASVTVGYSDAITGARQIRLLGLSGIYTQMQDENRPVMRGLASPFGLSYIPGQWLESIQIAKGPSSVINGVEAITGQINMEHRKPTDEKPLFINLFLSHTLRTEANVASSLQLNDKWSTIILGHFSIDPMAHDINKDGFKDEPNTMQFNFANRWLYYDQSGVQVRFGVKGVYEERLGGQMDYKKNMRSELFTSNTYWGSDIVNKNINGYLKVGVPLNADNSHNIAMIADYTYHHLDSYFGAKSFYGQQHSGFVNIIYQGIPNDNHRFSFGVRDQYDFFDETLKDVYISSIVRHQDGGADVTKEENIYNLGRSENQVGVYGEYTYNYGDKFTGVVDLSLDYNNLHGLLFSPRMNLKYSITDYLVLRASGGRGFRSPNIIVDNLGILSTNRKIKIDDNLDMERAWTYGGNITGYIPIGFGENTCYLSFDYFRTDFQNQIIVDQERDHHLAWIYNLDGRSYTNTYQADFAVEPIERFTILATFRYTDAKVTLADKGLVERPLTSKYKGVLNLQYATRMNLWTFDFTAQINGPARLPDFAVENGKQYSEVYPVLYAQVTRKFKGFDVYIGGENLTNYRQKNPIISAEEPYSKDFNATVVWGPLMGIKIYAGMRFTLWKK